MKKGILVLSNTITNIQFTVNAESSIHQLETPTGVEATGMTLSFNPVENTENYEVFAEGESIGEYTPASGYTLSFDFTIYGARLDLYINGIDYTYWDSDTVIFNNVTTFDMSYTYNLVDYVGTGSLENFTSGPINIESDGTATFLLTD